MIAARRMRADLREAEAIRGPTRGGTMRGYSGRAIASGRCENAGDEDE